MTFECPKWNKALRLLTLLKLEVLTKFCRIQQNQNNQWKERDLVIWLKGAGEWGAKRASGTGRTAAAPTWFASPAICVATTPHSVPNAILSHVTSRNPNPFCMSSYHDSGHEPIKMHYGRSNCEILRRGRSLKKSAWLPAFLRAALSGSPYYLRKRENPWVVAFAEYGEPYRGERPE